MPAVTATFLSLLERKSAGRTCSERELSDLKLTQP